MKDAAKLFQKEKKLNSEVLQDKSEMSSAYKESKKSNNPPIIEGLLGEY